MSIAHTAETEAEARGIIEAALSGMETVEDVAQLLPRYVLVELLPSDLNFKSALPTKWASNTLKVPGAYHHKFYQRCVSYSLMRWSKSKQAQIYAAAMLAANKVVREMSKKAGLSCGMASAEDHVVSRTFDKARDMNWIKDGRI